MLKAIDHLIQTKPPQQQLFSIPVSLHMLTQVLAYCQKHPVKRLTGQRLIPLADVRNILQLCYPSHFNVNQIKSWQQDLNFFHTVLLLLSADLLLDSGAYIIPSPCVHSWLLAQKKERRNRLVSAIETGRFAQLLQTFHSIRSKNESKSGLNRAMAYRPIFLDPPAHSEPLKKIPLSPFNIDASSLPDWLWFDIYQIAIWCSETGSFTINKPSTSQAISANYSLKQIQWLVERCSTEPLSPCHAAQLERWVEQGQTYSVKQMVILSVKHPDDLKLIFKTKKVRQAVTQQLSPRHVAIQPSQLPTLQKELARQGHSVPLPFKQPLKLNKTALDSTRWSWLAIRTLAGLRQYAPTIPTPAGALIDQLADQLSVEEHSDLEEQAQKIVNDIGRVIQGKDRFFPAKNRPPLAWQSTIEEAINHETAILLTYQSLGDDSAKNRTVFPHRLWHRAGLIYFSGWCELAGTDLTFRLDRAREVLSGQ